jgi:hypothetical protein
MTVIRILRILEYTYRTVERMHEDMGGWGLGANAVKHVSGMSIRSSTMPSEILGDDDPLLEPDSHERELAAINAQLTHLGYPTGLGGVQEMFKLLQSTSLRCDKFERQLNETRASAKELEKIDQVLREAGFEYPVGLQGVKDLARLYKERGQ